MLRGLAGIRIPESLVAEPGESLGRPWAVPAAEATLLRWERWLPHGLIATLLLGCGFNLGEGLSWWWAERALRTQYDQLSDQVSPILSARNQALQTNRMATELGRALQHRSQVALLGQVAELLPKDSRLLAWRYRGSELDLRIGTDSVDPRLYVRRFMESGSFEDVRVEPSQSEGLSLSLVLRTPGRVPDVGLPAITAVPGAEPATTMAGKTTLAHGHLEPVPAAGCASGHAQHGLEGGTREEYRRLAGEWLKLQDVSRQTAWPERAMQAEQVLNLQRERFWQAPNASQARADVQAWLTERVRLAGVPDAEVSVLLPRGFEKQGTIARIEAQVRGQLEPASFSRLLQDIEAEQRQVSVEFLELNNMLSPMLNLQLSFLFVAAY